MQYDILLRNGHIVDPANQVDKVSDIAISEGRVIDVGVGLPEDKAQETFNVQGQVVIPGIIDPHVHLTKWLKCENGHRMLAQAGVTTAIDAGGPMDEFNEVLMRHGSGLNVGCLNVMWPGRTVSNNAPSRAEIEGFVEKSSRDGALGIKILGVPFPLTPSATNEVIRCADERGIHLTFHVGTTETSSSIEGLRETMVLADGLPVHITHVNAYCRGRILSPLEETLEALGLLAQNHNIASDSYIYPLNAGPGRCLEGVPENSTTKTCLQMGGYDPTEKGLGKAILDGRAWVSLELAGENKFMSGERAYEAWKQAATDTIVGFAVNSMSSMLLLAIEKDQAGQFVVDAFCSDGGGIPRNVIVPNGIALVRLGALSWPEFVRKASLAPALLFGIEGKGHLGIGADADITVIDPEIGGATMGIVNGRVNMFRGLIVGRKGTLLTTAWGKATAIELGLDYRVIDSSRSLAYKRQQQLHPAERVSAQGCSDADIE